MRALEEALLPQGGLRRAVVLMIGTALLLVLIASALLTCLYTPDIAGCRNRLKQPGAVVTSRGRDAHAYFSAGCT